MSDTCFMDTKYDNTNVFVMPTARTKPVFVVVLREGLAGTESFGKTMTSGTPLPNEPRASNTFALKLQDRIKKRWPSKVQKAKELELIYPDPILAIVNLLKDLPGDYDVWREIIDEPYG